MLKILFLFIQEMAKCAVDREYCFVIKAESKSPKMTWLPYMLYLLIILIGMIDSQES